MEPAGAGRHGRESPERVGEQEGESINFFAELKRRNVYKVAVAS